LIEALEACRGGMSNAPERLYTQVDLYDLFNKIESALERHGKFQRKDTPDFRMNRLGCTFAIRVRLKTSRRKPSEIHGSGPDPWAAAENLMTGLDHWAKAWE
jgi:hypothetical protein